MRFIKSITSVFIGLGLALPCAAQKADPSQMLQMVIFAKALDAKCEALTLEGRLYAHEYQTSFLTHVSEQGGSEAVMNMMKKWEVAAEARVQKPCSEIAKDAQAMQVVNSFNDEGAVQAAVWTKVPAGTCRSTPEVLTKSKVAKARLTSKATNAQIEAAIAPRLAEFNKFCQRDKSGGPVCLSTSMTYDPEECVRIKTTLMFEELPTGNIMNDIAYAYEKLESFDVNATNYAYYGSGFDGVRGRKVLYPVQYKGLNITKPGDSFKYELDIYLTQEKQIIVRAPADMVKALDVQSVYVSPHKDGSDATSFALTSGGEKTERLYSLPAVTTAEWMSKTGEEAYKYMFFDIINNGKNVTRRVSLSADNMGMPISAEKLNDAYLWATAPALK